MYKCIILLGLALLLVSCNRQLLTDTQVNESEVREEFEINDKDENFVSPFKNLELDIFGNKYIYSDIELIKLNSQGDTVAVFNTRNTSSISSVSVSNPNKVIVYSRDNQRTWTLDSTLSVIEDKRVDLPELGEIGFVTRLEGDDILYYSRSTRKFYRINNNNSKIIESDVQWGMDSEIKDIVESQDLFIVRNEENQLYLFDSFGNLMKEVKVEINDGPVDFQNNFIYQIHGNQLRYFDLTDPTAEFREYKLSGGLIDVSDFKMARQKIYTLTNGKVTEQKIMIVNY